MSRFSRNIVLITILSGFLFAFMAPKKIKIHMAGDSTMADKKPEKFPETGWGTMFKNYFDDEVEVVNYAANGRSTKSFINEKRWQKLIDDVTEGDYVIIQFGHNDEKTDKPDVGTSIEEYKVNLTRFVREINAKKAFPVLCTPVMRRSIKEGKFTDSHGQYPNAVREVAKEQNVPLFDMLSKSMQLLEKTGIEESKQFFLIGDSTKWVNYPKGVNDNTHFQQKGAETIAGLAVECIKELKLPLQIHLKNK